MPAIPTPASPHPPAQPLSPNPKSTSKPPSSHRQIKPSPAKPSPAKKHVSVAKSTPMDGEKMAELAAIKLKQMDSVTKKMKASYSKATQQIADDEGEIKLIEESLSTLMAKYTPLCKRMEDRKRTYALLQGEFKKATLFMKTSLVSQQGDLQKVLRVRQKMEKGEASGRLKAERGFGTGVASTYTNGRMVEDEWAKAQREVKPEVLKKAKGKVRIDTVPIKLGGGVLANAPRA